MPLLPCGITPAMVACFLRTFRLTCALVATTFFLPVVLMLSTAFGTSLISITFCSLLALPRPLRLESWEEQDIDYYNGGNQHHICRAQKRVTLSTMHGSNDKPIGSSLVQAQSGAFIWSSKDGSLVFIIIISTLSWVIFGKD